MHYFSEPPNLLPQVAGSEATTNVAAQILEPLLLTSKELTFAPHLAESYDVSEDGKSIIFHLCQNVTWHDGEDFTSADVLYTYKVVLDEMLTGYGALEPYVDMEDPFDAPDDYTFIINLAEVMAPGAFLPGATSVYGFAILPEHLYNGTDITENPYNLEPVGTGPFKFNKWVSGEYIELVRNDNYWKQGKPYLDKWICKYIADQTVATLALESGDIHLMMVRKDDIPRLTENPVTDVYQYPGQWSGSMSHYNINLEKEPMSDPAVRRALYTALNRTEMAEKIGMPMMTSNVHTAKTYWWNPDTLEMYDMDGDIEKANQILDEAGYPVGDDGWRFHIVDYEYAGWTEYEDEAELLKEHWRRIDVDLEIKYYDLGVIVEYREAILNEGFRDYDIMHWSTSWGDDPNGFAFVAHSDQLRPGGYNLYLINDIRLDTLFEAQRIETDQEERQEQWYEIQDIMMTEMYIFPMFGWVGNWGYNTEFEGLFGSTGGNLPDWTSLPFFNVWWTKGSLATFEAAEALISEIEDLLADYDTRNYRNVDEASDKLDEARAAFDEGNYDSAISLAEAARDIPEPPSQTMLYLGIAAVVVIAAGLFYYFRRSS
ncbi:MAG: ABC transporter substrate-binding protein [Candidatus Bathyarchaeota archaeon]|nr:ABC transporter substrate-binding protein [Candidatus Bathyarchaeota archaeon]